MSVRLCALALLASSAFGAANMALSALTINSAGQIVATLSPCSSPLSPSSGATGITITDAANSWVTTVNATAMSGCTVTITTEANQASNFPVSADDLASSISITIAAASNLTDAGSNTIQGGGTTMTATSNSSEWYPIYGTAIGMKVRLDGNPSSYPHPSAVVKTAIWGSALGCIRFNATATQIAIMAFDYSNAYALLQDGGGTNGQTAYGSIANSGAVNNSTTWTDYSWSGMSGAHLYEVCPVNSNPNPDIALIRIVGTYGSQPAAKQSVIFFGASEINPSWFTPGVGTYSAYDARWWFGWVLCRQLSCSPQFLGQAGWPVTDNSGCTTGNCTAVAATSTVNSTPYIILVPGSTNWTACGAANNLAGTTFTATGVCGGTGQAGHYYPTTNLRDCASGAVLCKSQASGPYAFGSGAWAAGVMDNGGNDALTGNAIGAVGSPGTFTDDAVTTMTRLVTRFSLPKLLIIDQYCALGIAGCPNNAQVQYMSAWHTAATYYTGHSPVATTTALYEFNSGWIVQSTADFQGSPFYHLNPVGQGHWASAMLKTLGPILLGGTSYTITPNDPGTYTLALANGATFGGNGNGCTTPYAGSSCEAITLSDGGVGGTFTISGGGSGTSPYTFTPAAAATGFTFSYAGPANYITPVTISTTGAGIAPGWFDATPGNALTPSAPFILVP